MVGFRLCFLRGRNKYQRSGSESSVHHVREYRVLACFITGDVNFYHCDKMASARFLLTNSSIMSWGAIENYVNILHFIRSLFIYFNVHRLYLTESVIIKCVYCQVVTNGDFLHSYSFYFYCLTFHYQVEFSLLLYLSTHSWSFIGFGGL